MDSPELWVAVWLGAAATFIVAEILVAGSFFLAPLGVGAFLAGMTSLFGGPLWLSWGVFVVGSLVSFLGLRPLGQRLDLDLPDTPGSGANRLLGMEGEVTTDVQIGVGSAGQVRVGGENWRAEGRDGMGISAGTRIRIVEVRGTRLVVEPVGPALT